MHFILAIFVDTLMKCSRTTIRTKEKEKYINRIINIIMLITAE